MRKWKVTVETSTGSLRYRRVQAESLEKASDMVRAKIPITWRIVCVEEVWE